LTILGGAHLGWLAGVFVFVMATILVTIAVALLTSPDMVSEVRQVWLKKLPAGDVDEILKLFTDPGRIASILPVLFMFFTLLPALGGALGARLLRGGPANQGHA
jgi:hypothetical protein